MNTHRHLSSEAIFEMVSEGREVEGISGCASCEAEAAALSRFLGELKRADAATHAVLHTTEWDDLLLRRRIREAIAKEKPHSRSIFDRFTILRPAFVSALVAMIALAVWAPFSVTPAPTVQVASADAARYARLPAWDPLPEESEDEGLAVLAEWTPNEDELAIARCRASCLAGLSLHEEEKLLTAVALVAARVPKTGASPL